MIAILKHVDIEGAGTLRYFFENTKWDTKTVELYDGENLPSLDECDAIVSLGGPMNVYEEDKFPFLSSETRFLKSAVERDIPVLGICLGAQLLAKSMDAKVKKAKKEEVGWHRVRTANGTYADPLFKGLPEILDVFQWHEDTFDIPKEGTLLATSDICINQAMRIGRRAWGLQFHPEITSQMIEDWIDYYQADIDKNEMVDGYIRRKNNYEKQAQAIYLNFANVILKG